VTSHQQVDQGQRQQKRNDGNADNLREENPRAKAAAMSIVTHNVGFIQLRLCNFTRISMPEIPPSSFSKPFIVNSSLTQAIPPGPQLASSKRIVFVSDHLATICPTGPRR